MAFLKKAVNVFKMLRCIKLPRVVFEYVCVQLKWELDGLFIFSSLCVVFHSPFLTAADKEIRGVLSAVDTACALIMDS